MFGRLATSELPPDERERAEFIEILLMDLGSRWRELNAAVLLFDHAVSLPYGAQRPDLYEVMRQWVFMAGREAASAVYRASEDMEAIGTNLNRCPTLVKLVDHGIKRSATKKFRQYFPDFEGIRHAAQHSGKLYGTPERRSVHAPGPVVMLNNMMGRRLQTAFEGRQVAIDVTPESVSKLREVCDLYGSAFAPAAATLAAQRKAAKAESTGVPS